MPECNAPDNMWKVVNPSRWPDPPAWNSFSTLSRLEQCPRRWALSNANYADLWDGNGYPPKLYLPALEGTIVHSAVEVLMDHLLQHSLTPGTMADVTRALKEVGGYTRLLQNQINAAVEPFGRNPRMATTVDGIRQQLIAKLPELRFQMQTFGSRLSLISRAPKAHHDLFGGKRERGALPIGSHTEVMLEAPELRWRGVVDLLTVSESSAEITDFKTGEVKSEHEFQVRTYALLWMRDKKRNPQHRTVSKLVVAYSMRSVEVPVPTESELESLESELRMRTEIVLNESARRPPTAKPEKNICRWCEVRHLCDEYWEALQNSFSNTDSIDHMRDDIQVRLTETLGGSSWMGQVLVSSRIRLGTIVIIKLHNNDRRTFHEGQSLRLLDVYFSTAPESDPRELTIAINVSISSEVYIVN